MKEAFIRANVQVEDVEALAAHEAAYGDLADAVREVVDACIRTRVPHGQARDVAGRVRELSRELLATSQPGPLGLEPTSDGRLRDHGNPAVGSRNPIAPPLVVHRDPQAGRCWSEFELGAAYEGPPGHVHGGVIALVLDQVLGTVPAVVGRPGLTAYLTMTYRRPSPLGRLSAQAWVERQDGWKTLVKGRFADAGGETTVEAEGLFVVPRWARDVFDAPESDAGDFDVPPASALG